MRMLNYRVITERKGPGEMTITESHDMSQHFVETYHNGSVILAWIDSIDEFDRVNKTFISWERTY